MAALMAGVGAFGMLGLAPRITALHVVVTFLAFGAGWSWPVFTNSGSCGPMATQQAPPAG